jgi:hypothetical protein
MGDDGMAMPSRAMRLVMSVDDAGTSLTPWFLMLLVWGAGLPRSGTPLPPHGTAHLVTDPPRLR